MSAPREWVRALCDPEPVVRDPNPVILAMCRDVHRKGFRCTRREGHSGRHAAGTGRFIVAVWEQS